jgi:hypothetical protein
MKKLAFTCLMTLVLAVAAGCGGGSSGGSAAPAANVAPVADAGPAQTVAMGALVQLNGTASRDANNDSISYSWYISDQPSGSSAKISGATSTPTFTADLPGKFVVTLNVNDGKLSSPSSTVTITVTAPPLGVAGLVDRAKSKWDVSEVTSQLTGDKSTLIRLFSLGGTFAITCAKGQFTGYYLDTEAITANGAVAYRVGATTPTSESWNEASSLGYKRLTPNSFNINLLRSLYLNTDFYFVYNKFGGGGVGAQFTPSGFPATIDATRAACGWSPTMFPADNGWGLPYPTTAPASAIEPTYSLTAFSSGILATPLGNYFRVLAWKANNSQGRPQLLVRVGDFTVPCVGVLSGASYNSYYVTQNGKTVAAVSGTNYGGPCLKPEIYPLNGDFDASLPFTLSVYAYHFTDLNMGSPFATITFN